MTREEQVRELLSAPAGRLTCRELAEKMRCTPKEVGRVLSRIRHELRHMSSKRDGEKVILLWKGE